MVRGHRGTAPDFVLSEFVWTLTILTDRSKISRSKALIFCRTPIPPFIFRELVKTVNETA